MANPLDRTWYNTLIDDDGSGTTGTIWNKTQVDGLLDTVDTSLAGLVDRSGTPAANQLALFNDADTLTGDPNLTWESNRIYIQGNYPSLSLSHTAGPVDQRRWTIFNDAGAVNIVPTADNGNAQAYPFAVSRAGVVGLGLGKLQFPATQNPSADPYTCDDYREDNFTPIFRATGGWSGQVYTSQIGTYIKIGRLVMATGRLTLSTKGTLTGVVEIGGFPILSQAGIHASLQICFWQGLASPVSGLSGFLNPGGNVATLLYVGSPPGAGIGYADASLLTDSTDVIFTCMYPANS